MKTTFSEYLAYFEQLASLNKDIAHTVEKPAFFCFYASEQTEAKLRSIITRVPCIVVKDYDYRFQDNGADNLHKVRNIELFILDQVGRDSTHSNIIEVWESTENIGDELIMRMKHDKRNLKQPIINFNLNDITGVPADIGVASLYGTMLTIPISSVHSNDVDVTKWSDL